MFSKLVSQASQFAMEGVKNLVVKKHVSITLHAFYDTGAFHLVTVYWNLSVNIRTYFFVV